MGAIVTVKVKPGTDVAGIREKIQNALSSQFKEPVTVYVNVSNAQDFSKSPAPQTNNYLQNGNR